MDAEPTLNAAEGWKTKCLIGNGSVFDFGEIWTKKNVAQLMEHYVNNLDFGDGNFLKKLESQLESASDEAKILCAEMLWVMLLGLVNIGPASKRETISEILTWANKEVEISHLAFTDNTLRGVAGGGTAYNNLRWKELVYFICLLKEYFDLTVEDRKILLADDTKFAKWLEKIDENEHRQFRHILLFLLFPDSYDRVFAGSERRKIVLEFTGKDKKFFRDYSAFQIDQEMSLIRREQEKIYETIQLDWYSSPLRALWKNTSKKGETENDKFFPVLKQFLDQAKTSDLTTKQYPLNHSGLTMRISFGAGNQAHVPWIGFLSNGQTPTKGIYPTYLYFKQDALLFLIRGVSTTNDPEEMWPDAGLVSVRDYFLEELGKEPIRYPESFVQNVYNLGEPLDEETIENDLAELLDEYKDVLRNTSIVSQNTGERSTSMSKLKMASKIEEPKNQTLDEILRNVFISKQKVELIIDLLRRKKNIVLQGPPGVGKTFIAKRLASALMGGEYNTRVEMVQFHQSYSYEDFVQGYRPSDAGFELKNGLFHQFCTRARNEPKSSFVFIIDEINRGNLSKIFGELMMLIEADKRGEKWAVSLTYSKDLSEKFSVPENVHIIGLMNTADRSLSLVDYALRRRFAFIDLEPEFESEGFARLLTENGANEAMITKVISKLQFLNDRISNDSSNLGPGFRIGHSFFCGAPGNQVCDANWFAEIVEYEIAPLLTEYWFDDPKEVEKVISELLA